MIPLRKAIFFPPIFLERLNGASEVIRARSETRCGTFVDVTHATGNHNSLVSRTTFEMYLRMTR